MPETLPQAILIKVRFLLIFSGMWGFHDRLLTLRKALHTFLSSSTSSSSIYRRWRWQCHQQNLQYGLTLSEKEWQDEWKSVLRLASSEPRYKKSLRIFFSNSTIHEKIMFISTYSDCVIGSLLTTICVNFCLL